MDSTSNKPLRRRTHSRFGCIQCRKKKRRCDQGKPSCANCLKKGLECTYPEFKVLEFDSSSLNKKQNSWRAAEPVSKKKIDSPTVYAGPSPTISEETSPTEVQSTSSNTNSNGIGNLLSSYSNYADQLVFRFILENLEDELGCPKLHCKVSKFDFEDDYFQLKEETKIIPAYDTSSVVHSETKASSCVQSGIRVLMLDKNGNSSFAFTTGGAVTDLINNDITSLLVEPEGSQNAVGLDELQKTLSDERRPVDAIADIADNFDLTVHEGSLQNIIFIQPAAVSANSWSNFINLPSFVSQDVAQALFIYFLKTTQPENAIDIHWFRVCLPLVFSNITVFKSLLLYAIYHCRQNAATAQHEHGLALKAAQDESFVVQLYSDIIYSVKDRLLYTSSVSCDHTVMIMLMLLSVEVIRSSSAKLWTRYMRCTLSILSLRGGIEELRKTLTGKCLLQLLSYHLCIGISTPRFCLEISQCSEQNIDLLFEEQDEIFYDDITFRSFCGFQWWRHLLHSYTSVLHVYTHFTAMDLNQIAAQQYEAFDEADLNSLLHRVDRVSNTFSALDFSTVTDDSMRLILDFGREVCHIFIFQLIYRSCATSPVVIARVKRLHALAKLIFGEYSAPGKVPPKITPMFPLLCLGIYILGAQERAWYQSQIHQLYEITAKSQFQAVSEILDQVWNLDNNGQSYVDWLSLVESQSQLIPLYV